MTHKIDLPLSKRIYVYFFTFADLLIAWFLLFPGSFRWATLLPPHLEVLSDHHENFRFLQTDFLLTWFSLIIAYPWNFQARTVRQILLLITTHPDVPGSFSLLWKSGRYAPVIWTSNVGTFRPLLKPLINFFVF